MTFVSLKHTDILDWTTEEITANSLHNFQSFNFHVDVSVQRITNYEFKRKFTFGSLAEAFKFQNGSLELQSGWAEWREDVSLE